MGLKIYLNFWIRTTCFVIAISFSKYDKCIASSCPILETLMRVLTEENILYIQVKMATYCEDNVHLLSK